MTYPFYIYEKQENYILFSLNFMLANFSKEPNYDVYLFKKY